MSSHGTTKYTVLIHSERLRFMANANLIEIESCLQDCVAYCEQYPEHDFVCFYSEPLQEAQKQYFES